MFFLNRTLDCSNLNKKLFDEVINKCAYYSLYKDKYSSCNEIYSIRNLSIDNHCPGINNCTFCYKIRIDDILNSKLQCKSITSLKKCLHYECGEINYEKYIDELYKKFNCTRFILNKKNL